MQALGKRSVASLIRKGLGLAWLFFWIAAALNVAVALGYAAASIMAATGGLDPQWLHEQAARVRLSSGTVENYEGPDWVLVYGTLAIAGVSIAGALIVIQRLRKLFDSFTSGEPFQRENAYHLRAIWIVMLVVEVVRFALLLLTGLLLRVFGGPDVHSQSSGAEYNFTAWASILILIVLAEVFREGARLKEEQELTI